MASSIATARAARIRRSSMAHNTPHEPRSFARDPHARMMPSTALNFFVYRESRARDRPIPGVSPIFLGDAGKATGRAGERRMRPRSYRWVWDCPLARLCAVFARSGEGRGAAGEAFPRRAWERRGDAGRGDEGKGAVRPDSTGTPRLFRSGRGVRIGSPLPWWERVRSTNARERNGPEKDTGTWEKAKVGTGEKPMN